MTGSHRTFDDGLQAERTLLAWRRTALTFAGVSAAAVRFTLPALGWVAIPVGALGVTLALVAYVSAGRRYQQAHQPLVRYARHPAGGGPPTSLALATLLLGIGALVLVVQDD